MNGLGAQAFHRMDITKEQFSLYMLIGQKYIEILHSANPWENTRLP
jgi:hypothetical protein